MVGRDLNNRALLEELPVIKPLGHVCEVAASCRCDLALEKQRQQVGDGGLNDVDL
jgi:hypothetical protein